VHTERLIELGGTDFDLEEEKKQGRVSVQFERKKGKKSAPASMPQ
jgi:hypothetical protein